MSIFRLVLGCVNSLALLYANALARAEIPVLLAENLTSFDMTVSSGSYAKNDGVSGTSTGTTCATCEYVQVEYQPILRSPWDRVYQQALSESGHGAFSTTRMPECEDKFKWVGPPVVSDWVLMARGNSNIHLDSPENAARYRVDGYKDDAISQHPVDRGLQVQLALRDNKNVGKLASGQIDFWVTTSPSGRYVTQHEGLKEVKAIQRLHTAELFLTLSKGIPDELVQKLQTVVDALRNEGLLKQIYEHY